MVSFILFLAISMSTPKIPIGDSVPKLLEEVTDPNSGPCGDSATFSFDTNTKKLVVTGSGPMYNYATALTPWNDNMAIIESLEILEGITTIGDQCFMDSRNLKSVMISNSVTSIGNYAFAYCSSLQTFTIPNQVNFIGTLAFLDCEMLSSFVSDENSYFTVISSVLFTSDKKNIIQYPSSNQEITYEIPEGVTTIYDYAFSHCQKLSKIIIPDSIISIGNGFCYDCQNLITIELPNSITSLGEDSFFNCLKLESITLPENLTYIGQKSFTSCSSLNSLSIPNKVNRIGPHSFYSCSKLSSLTIPENVDHIGEWAFSYCLNLETLTILSEINTIESNAFSNNPNLTTISYGGTQNPLFYNDVFSECPEIAGVNVNSNYNGTDFCGLSIKKENNDPPSPSKLSAGAIAGIVIGAVVVISGIIGVIIYFKYK